MAMLNPDGTPMTRAQLNAQRGLLSATPPAPEPVYTTGGATANPFNADGTTKTRQQWNADVNTSRNAMSPDQNKALNDTRATTLQPYISTEAYKAPVVDGNLQGFAIGRDGKQVATSTPLTAEQQSIYSTAKAQGSNPAGQDLLTMQGMYKSGDQGYWGAGTNRKYTSIHEFLPYAFSNGISPEDMAAAAQSFGISPDELQSQLNSYYESQVAAGNQPGSALPPPINTQSTVYSGTQNQTGTQAQTTTQTQQSDGLLGATQQGSQSATAQSATSTAQGTTNAGGTTAQSTSATAGQAYDTSLLPAGFNWQQYAAQNPDLAAAGLTTQDAVTQHYLKYGASEGRQWNPVSTYDAATQGNATQWNAAVQDPASTFNASTAGVNTVSQDQRLGTVEGRIADMKDSELMQRASAMGLELAGKRGLLNSGMAIQSAQNAVLDKAIPIASQDAAAFNSIQSANQAAENRNFEFNATQKQLTDAANAASKNAVAAANAGYTQEAARYQAIAQDAINQFNANSETQARQFGATAQNAAYMQAADQATQVALQTLRGDQAKELSAIEAQYKNQIQSSASAASFYSSLLQQWTNSQLSTGTTPEQKAEAAAYYKQALKNGLAIISASGGGNGTDLSSLLIFDVATSADATDTATGANTGSSNTAVNDAGNG